MAVVNRFEQGEHLLDPHRFIPDLIRFCEMRDLRVEKYVEPTFVLGGRPQALQAFRTAFQHASDDVARDGGRLAYVAHPARGSEVPLDRVGVGRVGSDWRAPKAVLVDTMEAVEALVEAERHGAEATSAARAWILQQVTPRFLKVQGRPVSLRFFCLVDPNLETWLYKRGLSLLGVHERSVVHGCVQAWHSTGASGGLKTLEELSEMVRRQHGVVNFMDKLRYHVVPQAHTHTHTHLPPLTPPARSPAMDPPCPPESHYAADRRARRGRLLGGEA